MSKSSLKEEMLIPVDAELSFALSAMILDWRTGPSEEVDVGGPSVDMLGVRVLLTTSEKELLDDKDVP